MKLGRSVRIAMPCAGLISIFIAAAVLPLALGASPASAETRGYVISWFATATNNPDFPINCPRAFKDPTSRTDAIGKQRIDRAFINGKEVSPPDYPEATPDPNIETVQGKYAYGFDLGGPEANKFIDPETHEKVDDQLWRAVGCTRDFQFTPPTMPYQEGEAWNAGYADGAPAWAIQISGADLSHDGPVTVTLDRTLDHLQRDALGGIRSDVTYVIDPSPRSHNVLSGEIKNGVLWVKSGIVYLEGSMLFYPQVDLANTHMRMRSQSGGKLLGYWGGYTDWRMWEYKYTARGAGGLSDSIGTYHAMKRLADYDSDPVTAQNRKISTTWRVEAVPAFLATEDGKVLAAASPAGLGGQVYDTVASSAGAQTATNTTH